MGHLILDESASFRISQYIEVVEGGAICVLAGVCFNDVSPLCHSKCVPRGQFSNVYVRTDAILLLYCYCYFFQIYTDWANYYLERAKSKKKVSDLSTDCRDGILLADVIEAVTSFKVADLTKKPKTQQQMVSSSITYIMCVWCVIAAPPHA